MRSIDNTQCDHRGH